MKTRFPPQATFALLAFAPALAWAQDAEDLAKKLSNPLASLVSVPVQFNADSGIGPAKGTRYYFNVQPVIPVSLNANWNMISRTVVPIIRQHDIAGPSGTQTGLGDVVQSLFFSPKAPTAGGLIWGAGPVFQLRTASDRLLGAGKWGLGPTAVVLTQRGPWTVGALGNHIWSVGGDSTRPDISTTFVQPFLSYATKTGTTIAFNTESSYDWKGHQWSVPLNANISQIMKFGDQLVQVGAGARYWAHAPDSGPSGFGLRVTANFLFPK